MSNLTYSILNNGDAEFITVVASGHDPQLTRDDHPNYEKIISLARADDLTVFDLFDIAKTAETKFRQLSERVSARNGQIYLDGDPIHNAVATQITRFIEEGEDFGPLVNFFENVQANPSDHSRDQLFKFLDHNGMVISLTEDGQIVAYKGMKRHEDEEGVYYTPTHSGHIIVDGEDYSDSDVAKQRVDSVVEMPRSEVVHDPTQHCSVGLHISTFSYANSYGSVRLEVHVNPRDVVSVPNDSTEKVRACRYTIVGEVDDYHRSAVVKTPVSLVPEAPVGEFVNTDQVEFDDEVAEAQGVSQSVGERPPVNESQVKKFKYNERVLTEDGEVGLIQSDLGHDIYLVTFDDGRSNDCHSDGLIEIQDGPDFKVGDVVVNINRLKFEIVTWWEEDDASYYVAKNFDDYLDWYWTPEELTLYVEPKLEDIPVITGWVDNPTQNDFDNMKSRAKRRKRNFKKYATKNGWELIYGDDPDERTNWKVDKGSSSL